MLLWHLYRRLAVSRSEAYNQYPQQTPHSCKQVARWGNIVTWMFDFCAEQRDCSLMIFWWSDGGFGREENLIKFSIWRARLWFHLLHLMFYHIQKRVTVNILQRLGLHQHHEVSIHVSFPYEKRQLFTKVGAAKRMMSNLPLGAFEGNSADLILEPSVLNFTAKAIQQHMKS